jgi:dihydropteroate synthase
MISEGADIVDVGGESTRPAVYGLAECVDETEEIRRTEPVIRRLAAARPDVPISIDTRKSRVAEAALSSGACAVNDVTAHRFDPRMAAVVGRCGAAAILMHMRGTDPRRMQDDVSYSRPIGEVVDGLRKAADAAVAAGIAPDKLAVDPGLGFGKGPAHNLLLLARLEDLAALGYPVVVGASRKGFVRRFSGVADDAPMRDRLPGSLACVAAAAEAGAAVVRVHDVGATVALLDARRRGESWSEAAAAAGAAPAPFSKMLRAISAAVVG